MWPKYNDDGCPLIYVKSTVASGPETLRLRSEFLQHGLRPYTSGKSMAAPSKHQVLAEERQNMILKAVGNRAGVRSFIDFKAT